MPDPNPKSIYLKPSRPDLVIRDPRSRLPIPSYGARVPASNFWIRRKMCGDAIETTHDAIQAGKLDAAKAKGKPAATTKPQGEKTKGKE